MGLYPLHAHGIKCNVNPLTPNQNTFCLVVAKNINFKIPLLIYNKKKYFIFKPGYDIKICAKLLLSIIFLCTPDSESTFIMEVNSMKLNQTAPGRSNLIWLHIVYTIGYQNTSADNKADKKS